MSTPLERFYGTWRLVSYERHGEDGTSFPLGADAVGILVYTREGCMSGQIMQRGHKSATGYIAYCGPFHIDHAAGEVVHLAEASLFPTWVGTEQRRRFQFEDDHLILSATAEKDGVRYTFRLTWRRATNG